MFVRMWMTTELHTIQPETRIEAAIKIMAAHRIRRLPVVASSAAGAALVGILSSTDTARALAANAGGTLTAAAAMTADPITTTPDAPIESVAAIMRERKIGGLPVMHGTELVGLITESDVFGAFTALFDLSSPGARITFDISDGEDVLPFVTGLAIKHGLRVTSFVSLHRHERPMCVVHVVGAAADALLEDLWRSHHRVENILHTGVEPEPDAIRQQGPHGD